ncbi:MAG: sugar phosphate isomerase/epimerase family protein [Armatimonadota bacterium]|nr:sugar phosphate isomerase/epimerase family protein [Armatimonadota bacterium]
MRPGFMSSVCPHQKLDELIATAQRYGYLGIEFRSEWKHAHGVELESSSAERRAIGQRLAESGIAASCIATSVKFNMEDPAQREHQREVLRQYVLLAAEIGAPALRTFGDPVPADDPARLRETLKREAESYAMVNPWAEEHGVWILLETHGNLRADHAQEVLRLSGASRLKVNWHIGHHIRHGQSVDEAYACIRGQVAHVHFSLGEGNAVTAEDNRRHLQLLLADGYPGFVSVEVIAPPDPDAVLAKHMAAYREFTAS